LVEELTVEMQDHAGESHENRQPSDQVSDVTPYCGQAMTKGNDDGERGARRNGEEQRDIFRLAPKVVFRMCQEDVDDQPGEVEQAEHRDPQLVIRAPASGVQRTRLTACHETGATPRPGPGFQPCARAWGSYHATARSRRRP